MSADHPLVEFRKKHGISRPELARRLGVARETVYRWEMGQRHPSRREWPKISMITGITPVALAQFAAEAEAAA